jgi:hypothetical protein
VIRQLTYELPDDGRSLIVDFDDCDDARYEVALRPDEHDTGDGIVLSANRQACLAFARLFAQLAERGGHVHLGYSDEEPPGPGLRIVVNDTGRSAEAATRRP